METLRDGNGKAIFTERKLTLYHEQVSRLIKNWNISAISLVISGLDAVFQVDKSEFLAFEEYYSGFKFTCDVGLNLTNGRTTLTITDTEEI